MCFLPNFYELRRLIFDAVNCGGTTRYRYRQRGGDEGNVGDFSLVPSYAEKEERQRRKRRIGGAEAKCEGVVRRRPLDAENRDRESEIVDEGRCRSKSESRNAQRNSSYRRNARFGRRSFANRFALCFSQSRNRNKATIVKIDTVHKMLKLIKRCDCNTGGCVELDGFARVPRKGMVCANDYGTQSLRGQ
ncbi:hypothetical protein V8G54_033012 [Vigna mungo]|uniref:Uncharacterized protein n=1 Tax=Vigna mungo TaxID=3915 RepID=A0AAQ3MM60_VIGMU